MYIVYMQLNFEEYKKMCVGAKISGIIFISLNL